MGGWGGGDDEPTEREDREAANGVRQSAYVDALLRESFATGRPVAVTPSLLRELNRLAVDGLEPNAGLFRERDDQEIQGSQHVPAPAADVARLVDEVCAHVARERHDRRGRRRRRVAYRLRVGRAFEAAAFVLWRVNWIHPFDDGNGRTARAASYLVLCSMLGFIPPGDPPLLVRIRNRQIHYWRALQAADEACLRGRLDVSVMFSFLLDLAIEPYVERASPNGLARTRAVPPARTRERS